MRGIRDRVVVVTGGAGGIGAAICQRFAEEGAAVAVFDLDSDAAAAVAERICGTTGKARAFSVDLTSQEAVIGAVQAAESELGAIDVLVHAAGWDAFRSFVDSDKALWERIVAINLYGALHVHHAIVKSMVLRSRGRIVNIASDAARVGSSGEAVYAFCKGGLVAFSKTLARELARERITVNVVCPGPTDTPLLAQVCGEGEKGERLRNAYVRAIPFGRIGRPEDVPGAVVFLASDDAAFITGQVLSVSGGLTMAG